VASHHTRSSQARTFEPVQVQVLAVDLDLDRVRLGRLRRELRTRERSPVPGLPTLITRVPILRDGDFTLAIVEEPVVGRTLAAEARTRPFDEIELLLDLRGLACTLSWLHGQLQPLCVGPLRPGGVTRTESGRLVLQRFGALALAQDQPWTPTDDLLSLGQLATTLLKLRPPQGVHAGPIDTAGHGVSAATLDLIRELDARSHEQPPAAARAVVRRIDRLLRGTERRDRTSAHRAPLAGK